MREAEQVVLTTYGRSCGFCIDPIEKKPLNHFLAGSVLLSFGTAGCNHTCKFCQNWGISKSRDLDRLLDQVSLQSAAVTLRRARQIALAQGLHYVYTGNVHDAKGGTTFCPGCGAPLIERDCHRIVHYRLTAVPHRHRRALRPECR